MDRGKLLFDHPKLVFVAGPLILLVCLGFIVYDLYMGSYGVLLLFLVVFILMLIWFIYGIRNYRETIWENCAGVLNFPNPVPKTVWFADVKAIYPQYTYSPKSRQLLTSRLCIMDKSGTVFEFRDHTAVLTLALALSKKWNLYDPEYDIKNIDAREKGRMRMLLGFSNTFARILKFVVALIFGAGAFALTYLLLGWNIWPGVVGVTLVATVLAYFGSIFAIGAVLIKREDVKRKVFRMKAAGTIKSLDKDIVKAYMSTPPPAFDGTYDLFDELVSQVKKGRPAVKVTARRGPAAKPPVNGAKASVRESKGHALRKT